MANVELLFGPMLIGVFINIMLYGILVVQTVRYYQTYKTDATWIRYLVLYLFICETINMGFDIGVIYEPLIVRYGTPEALLRVPINGIMTVLISTPVQLFIAWRIKKISSTKVFPAIICFFAACSFVGGAATSVCVTIIPEYARLHQFDGAVITWFASSAAADVCITASLLWSLRKWRKNGLSTALDDTITKIMQVTLHTGAITTFFALADVLFFLVVPNTSLNFLWDFGLSKLYTNSLLSTFNARAGHNPAANQPRVNVLFGHNRASHGLPITNGAPNVIITGDYGLQMPNINTKHLSLSDHGHLVEGGGS